METKKTVLVWDLPTRVFHWALAATIALAWITAEADAIFFTLHIFFGEAVIALVVFRLIWGVVGGRHARFTDFVRPLSAVRSYLRILFSRMPDHYRGHNPAAGWMVLALLMISFLAAASGLFIAEDDFIGPFVEVVSLGDDLHEGLANLLLILIFIHVPAAFLMSVLMGENLIGAMWTGDKSRPQGDILSGQAPVTVPLWRALLAALLAGFVALWPFL